LKLAPLLAQFLYSHKRLDLPGIGTFLLETSFIEEVDSKQARSPRPANITFESNPLLKEVPDLIQYISSQTGKIRALAAADLDSHLSLIQQFVNIGKPFLLEGIGSLVKIRSGEFAFSSGEILPEKMSTYTARELSATSSTTESFSDYKKPLNTGTETNWRKPAVILLIIAGIGLAVWGGYTVYKITTAKNRSAKKEDVVLPVKKDETVLIPDTSAQQKDSSIKTVSNTPPGNFRFVLETANAQRAFDRYARLKTFEWDVRMETKDSLTYKLFMILPASAADTSRIIDSLSMLSGRRVYIE